MRDNLKATLALVFYGALSAAGISYLIWRHALLDLTAALLVAVILCALKRHWYRHILVVLLFAFSSICGGKPIVQEDLKRWLIVALHEGGIVDPSGTVGTATEAATVKAFAADAVDVVDAASNTLQESLSKLRGLTNVASVPVSYIASDLPRAIPGQLTNHNVIATIERTEDDGTNLAVYVWFSQALASAPKIAWRVSTSETTTYTLAEITNSYPDTVDVTGTACVRYLVKVPQAIHGIPFRPRYELGWGGSQADEYLGISSLGVSVTDAGGTEHLPYSGTDTYSLGGEPLTVTYAGGIAISATWRGTNYTERGKAQAL